MRQTRTPAAQTRARLGMERLEDRTTPATLPTGFTETAVATGLSSATAMEIAPNGDLWVLEQGGGVKRFRSGSTTADVVGNLSGVGLRSEGERGVLGIAFDPNYAVNKFVYLYYTSSDAPNPHNRISRFAINDASAADYSFVDTTANAALYDEVEVLNLDALSGATNHNGGAIHFGPDGKLYVAVGDNANGANAQSINNRHGKMLRINADGTIPSDNPTSIAGIAGTTSGANRAIWAAGLRNPFTFTFQPGTGVMHINDVGQNTWEEVNVGGAGRNFGWPGTEGDFAQASFPNFTRPLYAYSHGGGAFQGFAITGGAFYNPTTSLFPSGYAGDYFFADFVNDWINVVNADGTGVRQFATGAAGVVDLRVANDGTLLYLARDANQVLRVTFTGSEAPAITQQPASATASTGGNVSFTVAASGTAPLTYQWQKFNGGTWANLSNGAGVSGATAATLTLTAVDAADAGQYRAVVTNAAGSATSTAATLTVTANQPPSGTIAITSGLTGGKFVAGQAVTFSGTATDPEDGALGASAFTWQVDYITSIASGSPVVRPFVAAFTNATGGTFTPATTGPYTLTDVAYRVTLTVRDSAGLTATRTFDVAPNVANLTVRTSFGGGTLSVDGQPYPSGTVIPSVVGFQRPLGAPAAQTVGDTTYTFQSWSDGGAATHTVTTPATNTTYTAQYALSSVVVDSGSSGYSAGAGWQSAGGGQYYGGSTGYYHGAAGANAAAFAATLAAGTYRVSATWLAHPNRPTNASYAVSDGSGAVLASRAVDQERAADDFAAGGSGWEDIGTVTLTAAGPLTVRLGGGQAGEYLDADAVRFELVPPPPPSVVVDSGSAGYSAGAGWQSAAGGSYYGGSTGYHVGAAGPNAAAFTASLAAGTYRVSATWLAHPNRPTNASYAVSDGSGAVLASRAVDQERAADDFAAGGSGWEDIGTVTLTAAGPLTVRLGGGQAGEYLDADAVRFELVPPPPPSVVVDSGSAGYSAGAGWQSAAGGSYYGGSTGYHVGAAGPNAAAFTASLAAGTYRVSATWLAHPNRPTNAAYTVSDGSGAVLASRTVNQEAAPNDFAAGGSAWEDVGTVALSAAGALTVRLGGGQAGEYLDADAVRFELIGAAPIEGPGGAPGAAGDSDPLPRLLGSPAGVSDPPTPAGGWLPGARTGVADGPPRSAAARPSAPAREAFQYLLEATEPVWVSGARPGGGLSAAKR